VEPTKLTNGPTSNAFSLKRIELIEKHLSPENKRILDIGCGVGDYSYYFQSHGGEAIGLDLRPIHIAKGHSKNKNVNYIIGDAQNISIRSSTIDLVFINEVLEHVPDDEKVILESNHVLKNDGYISIFAPNKFYPFEGHWNIGGFGVFPFLSWAPTIIRKWVFKLFKRNYIPIYTRSILKKMVSPLFNIIDIHEILPGFKRYRKRVQFKKIIRIIESLEKTPLKRLGVSIFIFAKKKVQLLS